MVSNGLPEPNGTTISILESNQKVPGEFYAANNHGIFISTDSGESWRRLTTEWPNGYTPWRLQLANSNENKSSRPMCWRAIER